MNSRHFSYLLKRLLAEALSFIDYRKFYRVYWGLRAQEVSERYSSHYDYTVIGRYIEQYGITSIMDLGCGSGRLFPLYASAGIQRVTGVEISPHMVSMARQGGKQLSEKHSIEFTIIEDDVLSFSAPNDAFDLMVSARVLQHLHPALLKHFTATLNTVKPRYLYLSEIQEASTNERYIFTHDYKKLAADAGYLLLDEGVIETNGYHYRLFNRSSV